MGTSDVDGRQGTPLLPMAFLGTALTDGTTTTLTGGGTTDPAGTGDYFAYFPGYPWYITSTDSLPTESQTFYAMIYNVTGTDINKYEIVSYVVAGFEATGKSLVVTRGTTATAPGNSRANSSGRFQNNHPSRVSRFAGASTRARIRAATPSATWRINAPTSWTTSAWIKVSRPTRSAASRSSPIAATSRRTSR
jgi:hypothetical protein